MTRLNTALALGAASIALGCGGSRSAEFDEAGTPPSGPGPGEEAGSAEDATVMSIGDGATFSRGSD